MQSSRTPTDNNVTLEVKALEGFNRKYNPNSNTYNAKWRDHPHMQWEIEGNKN